MSGPVTRSQANPDRYTSPPPTAKNAGRQPMNAEDAYENKPANFAFLSDKKRDAPPGVSPLPRRICPRVEGENKEARGRRLTVIEKVRGCGEWSDIEGESRAAFSGRRPEWVRFGLLSLASLELPEGSFPTTHPELVNTLGALGDKVDASAGEVGAALRL